VTVENPGSGVPPTLAAGPSARELAGRFLRALALSIVGGVMIPIGALVVGGTAGGAVIFVGFVVCLVFGAMAFLVADPLRDAENREAAAGYTTLPGSRRGRWRLDYRTGAVIGPPEVPNRRE
jgi:hypothetical protein